MVAAVHIKQIYKLIFIYDRHIISIHTLMYLIGEYTKNFP